jgi:hypothetical protein
MSPGRGSSFRDVITDFLQQHDGLGESQKEFVQRLRDDDANRIDEIWSKLVEKQPELADGDRILFIRYLADAWTVIELAQYEAAEKKLSRLIGIGDARLKKYYAKRFVSAPPHELPKILSEMAYFVSDDESGFSNKLSDYFPELDIRSDHEGSRLRTAFMRFMSRFARAATGDWCDDEVATLTDIAFPRDETTSTDMVRSARRSMRTAR